MARSLDARRAATPASVSVDVVAIVDEYGGLDQPLMSSAHRRRQRAQKWSPVYPSDVADD